MPDFLTSPFENGPIVVPMNIVVRLLTALACGSLVALIYSLSRRRPEKNPSFPTTLIMLSILIAMVTQVIGESVARAFSLAGALAVVRFRTIVRDTQDTAYVIFAVVVGMSIGARNPWVAGIGIGVVALAAFGMRFIRGVTWANVKPEFHVTVRIGLGHDAEKVVGEILNAHLEGRELRSISTARQGISIEYTYLARLRTGGSPAELARILNSTEGVQAVHLGRSEEDEI
jgi:hypothetical protein